MKRSPLNRGDKPLQRTELKRSSMEVAKSWLARSKALGRKPVTKKQPRRDTGPDAETRELVGLRDSYACVLCYHPFDLQVHHRRPRQRGGDRSVEANLPSNLITVCAMCHQSIESHRTDAYEQGWLVRRGFDPADVPVWTCHGWRLLKADGSFVVVSEPDGEVS